MDARTPGRDADRDARSDGAPLRVGSVPYLVGRPLDHGLDLEPGIRFSTDVPARLVDRLRSGDLDVALVSTIELFRQPGYRFIDGIAVAGESYVGSVQVFLRKPIQDVESIAMDPSSRAAAALTRSLLFERQGGPPRYVEVEHGEDPREAPGTDAWLRIGDPALRETLTHDFPTWNPSEAWRERTGLPFIFAAWIVNAGVDIGPHLEAFARARVQGRAAIGALSKQAAEQWQLPEAQCRSYLAEECSYDPGDAMRPSLEEFQRRAARAGLCDASLSPEPIALSTPA